MKKIMLTTLIIFCLVFIACFNQSTPQNNNTESSSSIQISSNESSENTPAISNNNEEMKNNITPLDENTFTEYQQNLINLSKSMYIAHVNITNELSDTEKADFFRFIISTGFYMKKCEEWKTGEQYIVPLSDIKNIIFTHLDTTDFDPIKGFQELPGNRVYDEDKEAYITNDTGGYGGAAALGVLECTENDNTVNIILGSYDMNQYFSSIPTYKLIRTYAVDFLVDSGANDFKVLRAEFFETQKN